MPRSRYVALLRGINVGGNNRIEMAALRASFQALGLEDVATYIASGNVLFTAPEADAANLTARIEQKLAASFDYEASVVLRSHRELKAIVQRAPAGFGARPSQYRYDVIFLKAPLTAAAAIEAVPTNPAVDTASAGRGVLYFSRLTSKATASRLGKIVGTPMYRNMTLRNWNTTATLLRLMDSAKG